MRIFIVFSLVNKISYLKCPLCGRLCHLNSFKPEFYDTDIILVDMQSQGRGKGFKKIGEYSGLGDRGLMDRIAARLETLLYLIKGDSPDPFMAEKDRLDDAVEELEDDNRALQKELRQANVRISELEAENKENETIGDLVAQINEVLSETYYDPFQDLESAVTALIEEYDDLLEESEDEP